MGETEEGMDVLRTEVKSAVFPHEVGELVIKELVALSPDGQIGDGFRFSLLEGDPQLQQILDTLARHGFHPFDKRRGNVKQQNTFLLDYIREYDKKDFEGSAYLWPLPKIWFDMLENRSELGFLQMDARKVKVKVDMAVSGLFRPVVSDRIKARLEDKRMRHLVLKETEIVGQSKERVTARFWEVSSHLNLPPLSPSCTLLSSDREIFDGDYTRGCILKEGLYLRPELHYMRSSLDAVEPFDVAYTHERFGVHDKPKCPRLIVSNRFYRFCVDHRLKMDWVPVRIDPD